MGLINQLRFATHVQRKEEILFSQYFWHIFINLLVIRII